MAEFQPVGKSVTESSTSSDVTFGTDMSRGGMFCRLASG